MNSRSTVENAKPSAAGLALAIGFALLCGGMHAIAARHNLVTVSGTPLLLYNLGSIAFLTLCGASFFTLGGLVLPGRTARSRLDEFLLRSVTGLCLLMFLGYTLGLAGLLTQWAGTAALALPLCWFPVHRLSLSGLNRKDKAHLALFAAIALYLLAGSSLLFQYVENDFSHYYTMFDSAVRRADLLSPMPYYAYFYMKGVGAAFLMMSATSVFSVQLLTLYALLLMGLMAYRMCSIATSLPMAGLAAALLILASKAVKIESYKGHVIISMLLLAVPYILSRLPAGAARVRTKTRVVLALVFSAAILVTPAVGIFLAVPALYWAWLCWRSEKYGSLRAWLMTMGVTALTLAVILVSNFLVTGMPEVTPYRIFAPFFDMERTRAWISDAALYICEAADYDATGFLFRTGPLTMILGQYSLAAAAYFWARRILGRTVPLAVTRFELSALPLFALGCVCPILYVVTQQHSIRRFMVFYAVIQGCYVALCVFLAAKALVRGRLSRPWSARTIATRLCAIACAYALVFNWLPPAGQQKAYARHFVGLAPMTSIIDHWHALEVEKFDALIPDNEPVLPLYFSPYATFYKPQKYLRQALNLYSNGLETKLGPDAEAARQVYLAQGLRHFVANLSESPDPMLSMVHEAYGELFSPASVARHFRVRRVEKDIWIMVLDGTDRDGNRPDEAFLAAYRRRRQFDLHNPRNIFYPKLMLASKLYPGIVLPAVEPGP